MASLKGPRRVLVLIRLFAGILFCLVALVYSSPIFFTGSRLQWVVLSALVGTSFLLMGFPLAYYLLIGSKGRFWRGPEFYLFGAACLQLVFYIIQLGGTSVTPCQLTVIILLFSFFIGLFRTWIRRRAATDIASHSSLLAGKARVIVRNQEVEREVSDLKEGDQVLVHPGEMIPCDGVIITGTTSVDESVFTADKTVLLKGKGDRIVGSSLNRDGDILVKPSTSPEGHFLRLVLKQLHQTLGEMSEGGRESLWGLAVLSLLSLAFVAGWFLVPRLAEIEWVLTSLSFLLVTAGLILSMDITLKVSLLAMGWAVKNGILVLTADLWRKTSKMKQIFFDKTGTLTKGQYFFSQMFLEQGVNQGHFLAAIFSLEVKSEHALARAVLTHPWYHEISQFEVDQFQSHVGLGICGNLKERGGKPHFTVVGNQRFIKRFQMRLSRELRQTLEDLESMGETVILCGWDGKVRGLMSFADTLRPDLNALLKRLMILKIEPLMITGDHDEMMTHLSYVHGLKQVYTRCLTDEKKQKILMRQKQGVIVGMVGNLQEEDEVFSQADVGILMGAGSSLPGKKAGVVFFGSHLLRIASFISYARRVSRTILVGRVISSVLYSLAITLTLLVLISPQLMLVLLFLSSALLMLQPLSLKWVSSSA